MSTYADFLARKTRQHVGRGFAIERESGSLFPFQRAIVRWAAAKGRACIWADCGLGKTGMQLTWAANVPGNVLVLAPLAVAKQTQREGVKFGVPVTVCRSQEDVRPGVNVTNYEMLQHFDADAFAGVVLDESSVLKDYTSSTRNLILEKFAATPFRLACTATPAPNDFMELGNHAEFVGAMTRTEMLAMFFVHDGGETQKWRLKGHAHRPFWEWVGTWAVALRRPSDLGFDDAGFDLPPLTYHEHVVEGGPARPGVLFDCESPTLIERRQARKASTSARVAKAIELARDSSEQWILWCDLNAESEALAAGIPDAVEVRGTTPREEKERAMLDFADGKIRVLVTKPSIAGHGMNWQRCARMAFVGLSDSYESLYQATRRSWRFGQTREVEAHIITSDAEGAVLANVKRKEKEHGEMVRSMVEYMQDLAAWQQAAPLSREAKEHDTREERGKDWTMRLGDCVDECRTLPSDSIDFSVYSPPFASLYTYSDSERDMGNCGNAEEFMAHFRFLVDELYRVLKPGRLMAVHCMNLPTSKVRDGYIGIADFRGDLIRAFQAAGFVYHSEVCIWKDPVTAMQRTKALGLLHKTIRNDSAMSRQGIPDYVVVVRKPGENAEPISHTREQFPVELWQKWASPVWDDINPSDTLSAIEAREEADERHVCALQLEVIRRCLGLWSNPGDLVLSPFAGIGSEGRAALMFGRRFIGIELKRSYWQQACVNLRRAEIESAQLDLFAAGRSM